MKIHKFKIIVIISILLIIPSIYAPPTLECYEVGFCEGTYNLSCSYIINNYCPEDYGNWGGCKTNPYGSKCFPCDPDCDDRCGNVTISMPSNPFPSTYVNIGVTVYTTSTNVFGVWLKEPGGSTVAGPKACNPSGLPTVSCTCISGVCSVNFTGPDAQFTSSYGGSLYSYGAYANIYPYTVWGYGITKPKVQIRQPTQGQQTSTSTIIKIYASSMYTTGITIPGGVTYGSGRAILDITGKIGDEIDTGETNITKIELFLLKETYEGGYSKSNPFDNCITCTGTNCNLLATWTPRDPGGFDHEYDIFTYDWDSSGCGGDYTGFRIDAKVYDANSWNDNEKVEFSIYNPDAPCMENCPKVSTSLLNLILSKIKVWL